MLMSIGNDVLVLAADEKIWFDADSLIRYLREVEAQASRHCENAKAEGDGAKAIAASAANDLIRQIADGLVITSMTAAEEIRSRRESRRRH